MVIVEKPMVSAYKFYPLHPYDRARLRIAVKDVESGGVAVYGSNVLVFGATGSVAGFLRVSAAIWKVGHAGGAVPWTAYFDDFPTVVREGCEDQVDAIADELFDLVNVDYARTGRKGQITPREAEVLWGRLHWFNSYLFGRVSCEALHLISKRALARDDTTCLNGDLKRALHIVKEFMETARPLTLNASAGRTMYLFTDGSYEPGSDMPAGIGGRAIRCSFTAGKYITATCNGFWRIHATQNTKLSCTQL